jgi:glycosyltransferase involved in cell wall biosynthesis
MKIAVVTCYDQNDYVRARTLRTAFAAAEGVERIVIKNQHKGLLRYVEVPLRVLKVRFTVRPDAWVITFRGYEILPFMLALKGRKPVIFDEFINAAEYLEEHNKLHTKGRLGRVFVWWYAGLLKRCRFVLADTQAHGEYSAGLCGLPVSKYRALPVSTDETVFYPVANRQSRKPGVPFKVFYYGHGMTPLHGLQYVLDAAARLKDTNIEFKIVGGKEKGRLACEEATQKGARVTYAAWESFEDLAVQSRQADLCLGGPFGKTLQSQFVVTGKTYQFLASGTPVLVGENLVSGLFKDKSNCLLVSPANVDAIVEALTWAEAHPVQMAAIGKAGRKLYEQHFSQKEVNRLAAEITEELQHGAR